jgi:predicted nucleotidyltransferase
MLFGLSIEDIDKIKNLFKQFEFIDKVILYGSRAKGNYRPSSDIDITLFGKNLTLSELQLIENEIDDLLLPYKFDVSIYNQISNIELIEHIDRVGKVLYVK